MHIAHCNIAISLYGPTPWTKFRPPFAPKMGTYVSREFSLDTEFTRTYLRRQYQNHVRSPKWRDSKTTPKTGHPWDVMGSHHGPLAAARWYQRHGKVVPKPSAPT